MIIAAYAGSGKTTFAQKHSDICAEITSMSYARILSGTNARDGKEIEREKAAEYHVNNPLYPYNMIEDVLELEKTHKYIVIPSDNLVVNILQKKYGRSVILCYPDENLEEEYRKRYINRGNTEDFCQIFADNMKIRLKKLMDNKDAYHIVLKQGEYLEDKFEELEHIYREVIQRELEVDKIDELSCCLREKKENIWLQIDFPGERLFYQIKDIDDSNERQFIYDFGKRLYETTHISRIYSWAFDLRPYVEEIVGYVRTVEKEELLEALERHKSIRRRCENEHDRNKLYI